MPLIKKKIVIIGDDAVSLYTLRELLMDEHLEVIQLRQGSGTLGLVKYVRPDLVLLDNAMSDSGEAIKEALRQDEETRTIPIVLCSSADGENLRECVRRYWTPSFTGKDDAYCPGKRITKRIEGSEP